MDLKWFLLLWLANKEQKENIDTDSSSTPQSEWNTFYKTSIVFGIIASLICWLIIHFVDGDSIFAFLISGLAGIGLLVFPFSILYFTWKLFWNSQP